MNFASDAKREKTVDRTMMRIMHAANAEYLVKVNPHGQMVTCNTCHPGHTVPDTEAEETPKPGA